MNALKCIPASAGAASVHHSSSFPVQDSRWQLQWVLELRGLLLAPIFPRGVKRRGKLRFTRAPREQGQPSKMASNNLVPHCTECGRSKVSRPGMAVFLVPASCDPCSFYVGSCGNGKVSSCVLPHALPERWVVRSGSVCWWTRLGGREGAPLFFS